MSPNKSPRRDLAIHIVTLVCLPIAIALVNPNWLYTPVDRLQNTDAYIYHGLFRYFFDFASTAPSNGHYFVERLSWVVPGYVIYHILPPFWANAALHLGVQLTAVLALYATASAWFGRAAAFPTAILLSAYPWLLRAAGHDYVDGAGIAYSCLGLYLLTRGLLHRSRWAFFGLGVVLAALLISQASWTVYLPMYAIAAAGLFDARRRPEIGRAVLLTAGGGLGVFAAAMIFNQITVGHWDFLRNSLWFALNASKHFQGMYAETATAYGGRDTPTWLVLPMLLCCVTAWRLARGPGSVEPELWRRFSAAVGCFAVFFATLSVLHVFGALPYLQIYLYTSYLIPASFLVLAALMAVHGVQGTTTTWVWTAGFLALTFGVAEIAPGLETWHRDPSVSILVGSLAGGVFLWNLVRRSRPLAVGAGYALFTFVIGWGSAVYCADRDLNGRLFTAVQTAIDRIDQHYADQKDYAQFTVWYPRANFTGYASAVASVYQVAWGRIVNTHPDTELSLGTTGVPPTRDVLLFSNDPGVVSAAQAAMGPSYRLNVFDRFTLTYSPDGETVVGTLAHVERFALLDAKLDPIGENVGRLSRRSDGLAYAWTGPGEAVTLHMPLPAPSTAWLNVDLCVLATILPAPKTLPGSFNSGSVTLQLANDDPVCPILYRALIPASLVIASRDNTLALTIPTASADTVFHNDDQSQLGMAIHYVRFASVASYQQRFEAAGDNVGPAAVNSAGLSFAWTGPGDAVVLRFQPDSVPGSALRLDLCVIAIVKDPGDRLAATVNGQAVVLKRSDAQTGCPRSYSGDVPASVIQGDQPTALELRIPTAPADEVFHNGDMDLLGLAIDYIELEEAITP